MYKKKNPALAGFFSLSAIELLVLIGVFNTIECHKQITHGQHEVEWE